MKKESLTTQEHDYSKLLWLLAVGSLVSLSFGAASGGAKRLVKERAGGKCESCGEVVGNRGVIGHLDHTKMLENGHHSNRYNVVNNLRLHCLSCEAAWHIQHIGRAKDIGLTEKNNNASVAGNLMNLYYYHSKKKFWQLYELYKDQIDELFKKLGRELPKK